MISAVEKDVIYEGPISGHSRFRIAFSSPETPRLLIYVNGTRVAISTTDGLDREHE